MRLALTEMYVSGVSTCKVARVTEQLYGFEVSSSQVSRCTEALDDKLMVWRERPLGADPYVVLDARYEKMCHGSTMPVLHFKFETAQSLSLLAAGV